MVKLWSCFPWVFWNLCSLSQLLPTSYLSSCWSDAPFYGSEWSEESFGGIYETLVPYLKVASITFLLTQDFLWDAFFLFFSTRCRNVARLRWPFSSAISGGNDWMNYGSVLRLGHRGSISCRNRILSESDHRITKKNTTKSAEAPMLSQGLERCTSWFLSLDFHLKNCWTSWYPLMFSGILSPGGETLHKHFILLDHVVS